MRRFLPVVLGAVALTATLGAERRQDEETGELIYNRQCAMCHARDGSGQTGLGKTFKLRDLRSPEVQSLTDSELYEIIAKGRGRMPAYQNNLGNDRIHRVIRHIRALVGRE